MKYYNNTTSSLIKLRKMESTNLEGRQAELVFRVLHTTVAAHIFNILKVVAIFLEKTQAYKSECLNIMAMFLNSSKSVLFNPQTIILANIGTLLK
jgi:hypothetical protein